VGTAAAPLPPQLRAGKLFPGFVGTQPALSVPATTALPRITVVTPSYNHASYLEATLRSVLEQGYPNLEYFVIDGGSTDGSRDILAHYGSRLDYWVSERDAGQSDAIRKGLARATGEWFNWINSDDLLAPGALWRIAAAAAADVDVVAGVTEDFRGEQLCGRKAACGLRVEEVVFQNLGRDKASWHQPSIWLRRAHIDSSMLDPALHYSFDYDLLLRYLCRHPRVRYIPDTLAYFRLHEASKTVGQPDKFQPEQLRVLRKVMSEPDFAPWRTQIDLALRRWDWRARVERILEDRTTSRWSRIVEVLQAARQDPQANWSKDTRRTLRRLLLRGGKRSGGRPEVP
jgi:glycosyltransferase involved in cell wall biosynthesis